LDRATANTNRPDAIGLVIAAGVTWEQLRYVTRGILRVPTDQMLVVDYKCDRPFINAATRLPDIRGAVCANESFLTGRNTAMALLPDGTLSALTQRSGCALLLACLALVGVAAATAERRTREIGVRKAMGAGTAQLMRLLLWRSTRPVLWANLIAWPAGAWVMRRWLAGFAYHVDLDPSWFAAATSISAVLALLTVSAHCYRVAREKPAKALRYE
jgi:hypothetical protein